MLSLGGKADGRAGTGSAQEERGGAVGALAFGGRRFVTPQAVSGDAGDAEHREAIEGGDRAGKGGRGSGHRITRDRSEERRVGKECRSRWSQCDSKKKAKM